MKTIIILTLAIIISIPVITQGYEVIVGGLQEYDKLRLNGSGTITKVYDHDEHVICYTFWNNGPAISCINDLTDQ